MIAGGVTANPFTPPYYCVREVNTVKSAAVTVTRCGYDAILETCDQDVSEYFLAILPLFEFGIYCLSAFHLLAVIYVHARRLKGH
jgi:hypothetical protein